MDAHSVEVIVTSWQTCAVACGATFALLLNGCSSSPSTSRNASAPTSSPAETAVLATTTFDSTKPVPATLALEPDVAALFGLRTVLVQARYKDVVVVAGLAPGSTAGVADLADLVLGSTAPTPSGWAVTLLVPLPTGFGERGCAAERADSLLPEGVAIVATCITGGTDRVGYVAVVGFPATEGSRPAVLLTARCGTTSHRVEGSTLRIMSSDPLANTHTPSRRHPDVIMTWGGSSFLPDDLPVYVEHCRPVL